MLRKSLAVLVVVSAMILAIPAGALSFYGASLGADRGPSWTDLSLERDRFELHRLFPIANHGMGSWKAPSTPPRHFVPDFPRRHRHVSFPGRRTCSAIPGGNCGSRPGSAVPEPGAALLFGAGALLVGRRLRPR